MKKQLRRERAARKAGRPLPPAPARPPVPIKIVERDAVDFDNLTPGLAWWSKEAGQPEGTMRLTFVCPGGCGDVGGCRCAQKKPGDKPSWEWNGSLDKPTLKPSIRSLECGWHGYLTDGVFQVLPADGDQCRGPRE